MVVTYIIEEKNGVLIQHNPIDILPWADYGTSRTAEYLATIETNFHSVWVDLLESEKVVSWTKENDIFTPTIINSDWIYTQHHIRMLILESECLKKKNGVLADLTSDMLARKVPYEIIEINNTRYFRSYFSFLEKDDGFEIIDGIIQNNDNKFSNVSIEQFGTFSETVDLIIQN